MKAYIKFLFEILPLAIFFIVLIDIYIERFTGSNIFGFGKLEINGVIQPHGDRVISFFRNEIYLSSTAAFAEMNPKRRMKRMDFMLLLSTVFHELMKYAHSRGLCEKFCSHKSHI